MNKKEIKELIAPYFTAGVISETALASILNMNRRNINRIKNEGKLHTVDRGVYAIDDVTNFLSANPRYVVRIAK